MKDREYALKEAFLYTVLVAIILLAPLYLYMVYMKGLYEVKNELELKKEARFIIHAMENYDQSNEPFFNYPRFRSFESGLYDQQFQPIFTLISHPIVSTSLGYNLVKEGAYLVMPLPKDRYFQATYLILFSHLSYAAIYQKSALILLSIVILVFILSLIFLRRFAAPFQRVNEQLDNFIKDSMHEINTPLSIMNVNIDLYNLNHEPNKYFKRIKAASKTLANVYNDMDYLIKQESIDLARDEIDLSQFVKDRIEYFEEVAGQKMITIHFEIKEGIKIRFNLSQLQRIVDNNLSNAIKYSHENSLIEVSLFLNSDQQIVLVFKDYGIGIENTKKIFDRYYREERDKGGFGIGLNIVKSIIDEVGITLEVSSKYKEGSDFIYTFPHVMQIT